MWRERRYAGDRRWLTALERADVEHAAVVVTEAGFAEFGLVEEEAGPSTGDIPGWTRVHVSSLPYLVGERLTITTYVRTG
jgi:hypothetical protein